MTRSELPIDSLLQGIVAAVRQNPITLLEAEPGAGKTTRVPPALLAAGLTEVLVLEPRRIAARMAAARVAEELGERVGDTVGYQVRFEERAGPHTKLRFLTEGVLTRRLAEDRLLTGVNVVVLDEFHERHLETDLALTLLRRLQQRRPDLRLLIMSATLNAELLEEKLGRIPVLRSPGRQFPIDVHYTPYSADPLEEQVARAVGTALRQSDGHVLVFLPGSAEIRRALQLSEKQIVASGAQAFALHGDLPPEEQDRAVAPTSQRKVIFSTNVAESSITIDGVTCVIDSGLARIAEWSPWSGLSRLRVQKISRSSAIQRAGRAGRTGPGSAIRLYTEEDFNRRPAQTAPEILRADLSALLLQLAAMELSPDSLEWLDPLPEAISRHAIELLSRLNAITADGRVTPDGRRMAGLPVHPRLARFLLAAARFGVSKGASKVAALLSEGRLRLDAGAKNAFVSDIDAVLATSGSPNVRRLEQQIARKLPSTGNAIAGEHSLEKALLYGYGDRVARRRGETLLLSSGGSARLDASSAVRTEFLCAIEAEERDTPGVPLVRIASPLEPDWLLELFPERVQVRDSLEWNREAERAEQVSAIVYDSLVVDESRQPPKDPDLATEMLVAKAVETGIEKFLDKKSLERLLSRIQFARQHSNVDIPGDDEVLRNALGQLAFGSRSFAELRAVADGGGLERAIESILPMNMINEIAPGHVQLPSGRRARIEYSEHQAPWVASRLQDFFGMRQTPRIARGSVPVVVHLLAPNQRPVQVTEDLTSFWEKLYPQVRRELSRRYPRHKWPEDPYQRSG